MRWLTLRSKFFVGRGFSHDIKNPQTTYFLSADFSPSLAFSDKVTDNSMATSRSPLCPDCGSRLPYARINLANPFECPSCDKKLCVPPEYNTNIRRACVILTIALYIIFFVSWKSIFLAFFLAVIASFIVGTAAQIFWKRIFPPEIQDCSTEAAKARYIPLLPSPADCRTIRCVKGSGFHE
jgi:hypothetical protein